MTGKMVPLARLFIAIVVIAVVVVVVLILVMWSILNPTKMSIPLTDSPSPSVKGIDTLKAMLTHYEGERLTVYLGPQGHPTVGIGHKVVPSDRLRVGDTISQRRSNRFFVTDVAVASDAAVKLIPNFDELNAARQHVVVGMIFQLGEAGVRKFHNFLDAVNRGDYDAAAQEMLYANPKTKRMSAWCKETPKRCSEMAEQMRRGKEIR